MIVLIAAAAENNALGKDNDLLWHLPNDFKRFKKLTSGHTIIMGRKTFESLPGILPNRTHVIITRDRNYTIEGGNCIVAHSLSAALEIVKNDPLSFIIGGGEIYTLGMEVADKIELTRVHGTFEADTFFPSIPDEGWNLNTAIYHPKDAKHQLAFTFLTYEKV